MNRPYSYAILAGGQNKRFGGNSKALADIYGIPVFERILKASSAKQNMIITNSNCDKDEFLQSGLLEVYPDLIPGKGPLSGLHSALKHAREEIIVMMPSDLPLMKQETVMYMLQNIKADADALVPRCNSHTHPVSAIYRRNILKKLEDYLRKTKDFSIYKFLRSIQTQYLDIPQSSSLELSFYNMNTEADYLKILKVINNENNQ
jgi:molybdopterin-guanine dinucleotide biosynthesis protein A